MSILITGAAGFIGYHTASALLKQGERVVGLDNLNAFYDASLKQARLQQLERKDGFRFALCDLTDRTAIADLFAQEKFRRVIHLGAQAGVRYSLANPHSYVDSNITGTLNILESCKDHNIEHLVYASSSSVYGANTKMPFSEHHPTEHPVSIYAATKKSNELMAHVYASLYQLPVTGLRFFTVYGPWGRPDMALFTFTKKILTGEPIEVFNNGKHRRDFTYIDDIVDGILLCNDKIALPNPTWSADTPDIATSAAPYRIYNIGNSRPIELGHFIKCLEDELGMTANKVMLPMQLGDISATFADVSDLTADTGFSPKVSLEEGIHNFVMWYRSYYGV